MLLQTAVVATVVALSLIGVSAASDSEAAIKKPVDIPAQGLGTALESLAKVRGFQVVYLSDEVDSLHTTGVSGQLTADEALNKLLSGSGLSFSHLDDSTVTVFPTNAAGTAASNRERGGAATHSISSDVNRPDDKQTHSGWLHLASAGGSEVASEASTAPETANPESSTETVTVTGSRLSSDTEGPQETVVYNRKSIAQSGQLTVLDFLNTLPAVSTVVSEAGYDTVAGAGAIRLRGLPIGSTLVLLDGRSVEGAGSGASHGSPFDINMIPSAAVERIEIVPEASSAVYGSDAIGGVVNIILRKKFDGLEVNASTGGPTDHSYSDTTTSAAFGKSFSRGSFSLIGSYQLRGSLSNLEREITKDQDYRRYGGHDDRGSNCNPGNVSSIDGSNLPGLTSPNAAIPNNPSGGKLTPADFLATAGMTNLCSYGSYGSSIIPSTRRLSFLGNGEYELTDTITAFFQGMYSEVRQNSTLSPRSVYSQLVPADNPFNPFGVPVAVTYRFSNEGLFGNDVGVTYFGRVLAGLRGRIGSRWDWEVAAWQSQDHGKTREANTIDTNALATALANTDPAQSVNLFGSGVPASASVLARVVYQPVADFASRLQTANGFIRGDLFDLPAGAVKWLLGGEYARHKESMYVPGEGQTVPDVFSRSYRSGFTELNVPVLGRVWNHEGNLLSLSFAGRYDNYSDFGGKFTPQGGVELRPLDTLLLRASYSKAFKAPDLRTVYSSTVTYANADLAPDPYRGGEVYGATLTYGGNRNIRPQTGNSRSFGLVWTGIENLQVSVTNFRITEEDRITTPAESVLLAYPDVFSGMVVRAPPTAQDIANGYLGRVISIQDNPVNYGDLVVEGVDTDIGYKWDTAFGTFSPQVAFTNIYKFDSAVAPGAPIENRLGYASDDAFATRWKGTGALGYSRGPWSVRFASRYISKYIDYDKANLLGDYWLFDASAQFDASKAGFAGDAFWHGAYVTAAVVNLTNKLPQFTDYYGTGYDPRMADIRGRYATVTVGLRF